MPSGIPAQAVLIAPSAHPAAHRCECRWGFTGHSCATSLLPACALGPNATALQCGDRLPRPCACLRQCYELFCPQGGACSAPRNAWLPRCFEVVAHVQPRAGAAQVAGNMAVASEGVYSGDGCKDTCMMHPLDLHCELQARNAASHIGALIIILHSQLPSAKEQLSSLHFVPCPRQTSPKAMAPPMEPGFRCCGSRASGLTSRGGASHVNMPST